MSQRAISSRVISNTEPELAPSSSCMRIALSRYCNLDSAMDDVEAIKRLKARYCRLLDQKEWTDWRELFTDRFISDTSAASGTVITGADEFVAFVKKQLDKPSRVTVHQVHAPEIELISPDTAQGVWAMADVVTFAPGLILHGYGHYHETDQKTDGQWRIATSRLTRLREDIVTPALSLHFTDRLKKTLTRAARR